MRLDEFGNLSDERIGREHILHVFEPFHQGAFAREQHAIGLAQFVDLIAWKAMALEADDVEAGQIGAVAEYHSKRNDVFLHARHATDETVGADANELMHGTETAENCVVANSDVAGQSCVIDENDVVPDLTIMGNVRPHHQQAMGANAGYETAAFGAGVDRDVLADRGVGTDFKAAVLAVIFLVLRDVADRGKGKDLTSLAYRRATSYDDVGMQGHAISELDLGSDHAERPDFDIGAEVGMRIDHGGRMNVGHARNFELRSRWTRRSRQFRR